MYVYFDPDNSVDWVRFFENEPNQEGSNGFRAGSLYQRGNGAFSQLLGKLFISAVPLLRRMGVSVGKEMLDSSLRVANDVAAGDSFKSSLSKNATTSYNSLLDRAIVKLLFNNVLVYDSNYYDYKSYIHTLFGENGDTKNGFLTAAGWTDPGDTSTDRVITESRPYEICAPLFLEPFQTERLLVPHINIQLDLYRNSDEFCLEASKATKATLEMYDLKLHMRAIDVVSSAAIALESRLRTTPAQYPFTVSKVKIIAIPAGRLELPFTTLYHDIIPRRVIVGILSPEISSTTDQFNFEHANLSEIQLDAAGTMYPPQPIQCDFSNKHYTQAFIRIKAVEVDLN
ncbi:unnamed protein product [Caenorhabditis brenneri]